MGNSSKANDNVLDLFAGSGSTMIFSQVQDDWRAALELLSRKYPEQWAKKEYMDFKGSIDTGHDKKRRNHDYHNKQRQELLCQRGI